MVGHRGEGRGQGRDPERLVIGDGQVMFASRLRGQPQMAPGLAGHPIAEPGQGAGEVPPAEVAGQSHALDTSSRTKWRRITLGAAPGSK